MVIFKQARALAWQATADFPVYIRFVIIIFIYLKMQVFVKFRKLINVNQLSTLKV